MRRLQQITSAALKKRNQERRFEGSETDRVKINTCVNLLKLRTWAQEVTEANDT